MINKDLDQTDFVNSNKMWIEENAHPFDSAIVTAKRIGLNEKRYGLWALKPWRFYLKDSIYVSKRDKTAEMECKPD